jgi:DNA-binding NarL/FixJ family response regulator
MEVWGGDPALGRAGAKAVRAPVLVADSDDESRATITALLGRLACVTAEATTGEEALEAARRERPALVVLDVHLAGTSGYGVCRELRDQFGESLPIMFVSDSRVEIDEVAALLLGADDFLVKPIRTDQFLARVRRLLARSPARPVANSGLTPRELEVLELLVDGRATGEIAALLCITPKTASTHLEHILGKLGAHSRAQAVAFAVRDQLVGVA